MRLPLYVQINERAHQKVFWFVLNKKTTTTIAKVEHDTVFEHEKKIGKIVKIWKWRELAKSVW